MNENMARLSKYIYLMVVFVMMASSCAEDRLADRTVGAEGEIVSVDFSFRVPRPMDVVMTRTEEVDEEHKVIKGLLVYEFDENGYLIYNDLVFLDPPVDGEYKCKIKVVTSDGSKARCFQFLGVVEGLDEAFPDGFNLPFGSALDHMATMRTGLGATGFWQMYMTRPGERVDSDLFVGKQFEMVRNKAKITVVKGDDASDDFELLGFKVYNKPDRGGIVPYNVNGEGVWRFAHFYPGMTYEELYNQRYHGHMLNGMKVDFDDGSPVDLNPVYIYEHTYQHYTSELNTFVVVKAEYGGGEYFYKVTLSSKIHEDDIMKTNIHILRNFNYIMSVDGITGAGYPTLDEAANGAASNDIVGSVVFRDFSNISIANERMFVEYTNKFLVSDKPVYLKYKYVPDIAHPDFVENDKIKLQNVESQNEVLFSNSLISDIMAMQIPNNVTANEKVDKDGWSVLRFVPNPGAYGVQSICIGTSTVNRVVTFIRKDAWRIKDLKTDRECYFNEDGTKLNVSWKIIGNLPDKIFPLRFFIESDVNNINVTGNPDENMPVRYSESMDGTGRVTYQFEKKLTWDEYSAMPVEEGFKTISVPFQILVSTENDTDCRIYVGNELFESGECAYNVDASHFVVDDGDYFIFDVVNSDFSLENFDVLSNKLKLRPEYNSKFDGEMADMVDSPAFMEPFRCSATKINLSSDVAWNVSRDEDNMYKEWWHYIYERPTKEGMNDDMQVHLTSEIGASLKLSFPRFVRVFGKYFEDMFVPVLYKQLIKEKPVYLPNDVKLDDYLVCEDYDGLEIVDDYGKNLQLAITSHSYRKYFLSLVDMDVMEPAPALIRYTKPNVTIYLRANNGGVGTVLFKGIVPYEGLIHCDRKIGVEMEVLKMVEDRY